MNERNEQFEPAVFRLADMSGLDFEDAVETLFDRIGYRAEVAERVGDLGRDVIARRDGETIIVECKHTKSKISRPDVQKVHSAALSYGDDPESTRAIIVSTGGFTGPAREHAHETLGRDTVELWDYETLVERGRSVEVYFPSEEAGTDHVFRAPRRDADDVGNLVDGAFISELESVPRDMREVADVERDRIDEIPALLVEYSLDETFGTSTYPRLHHARARGRTLITLDDSRLRDAESSLWEEASFSVDCRDERPDEKIATQFGVDPDQYESSVSRRIARMESTTVRYTGRNNQTYTKDCEVDPEDVSVRSRQVLLHRQQVSLAFGPARHTFELAEHPDHGSALVDSEPMSVRKARAIWRGTSGIVCNDCASIILSTESPPPRRCADCRRTLCDWHTWSYPAWWPWSDDMLCSRCYDRRTEAEPEAANKYNDSALAALVPLIGLANNHHWIAFSVLLVAAVATVAVATTLGPSHVAAMAGYWIVGLLWLGAGAWLALQMRRARAHRRNLTDLADYEPDWSAG